MSEYYSYNGGRGGDDKKEEGGGHDAYRRNDGGREERGRDNDRGERGGYDSYRRNDYRSNDREDRGGYGGYRGYRRNDERSGGYDSYRRSERDDDRRGGGGYGGYRRGGFRDRRGGFDDRRGRFDDRRDGGFRRRPYNDQEDDYDSLKGMRETLYEKQLFKNYTVGINFDKYDTIPVECYGEDIPEKLENFQKVFPPLLEDNVVRAGFKSPTPVQKHCIPIAMAKRDVMACAETGSGKTAGFIFPIIARLIQDNIESDGMSIKPEALVLAPTRELAQQIYREALKFTYKTNLKCSCVFGGVKVYIQKDYIPGTNILIATPGRLSDMCRRGMVNLQNCLFFVLDEGDRMLDMGFMPQIDEIVESGMGNDERQTMMFSATFPKEIREAARRYLKSDFIFIAVGQIGGTTTNIHQEIRFVEEDEKDLELQTLLDEKASEMKEKKEISGLLVFVNRKAKVDELYFFFESRGLRVGRIHGDKNQKSRDNAIRDLKRGEIDILFTTDVLARGIDIGTIDYVINYDMPLNGEDYIHRIGRTGRVGRNGYSISFFSHADGKLAKYIIQELEEHKQEVPQWLRDYQQADEKRGGRRRYGGGGGYRGGSSSFRRNDDHRGGSYGGFRDNDRDENEKTGGYGRDNDRRGGRDNGDGGRDNGDGDRRDNGNSGETYNYYQPPHQRD